MPSACVTVTVHVDGAGSEKKACGIAGLTELVNGAEVAFPGAAPHVRVSSSGPVGVPLTTATTTMRFWPPALTGTVHPMTPNTAAVTTKISRVRTSPLLAPGVVPENRTILHDALCQVNCVAHASSAAVTFGTVSFGLTL